LWIHLHKDVVYKAQAIIDGKKEAKEKFGEKYSVLRQDLLSLMKIYRQLRVRRLLIC
jgi:hypothetical protein